MGKSARAHNARLAQLRAEQARRERRTRLLIAGGTVGVILAIVAALAIVAVQGGNNGSTTVKGAQPLDQAAFAKLTSVPPSAFDTVGLGSAQNGPKSIDAQPITKDGKPRVLYVGAEYCPFCASQRWALVTALSRFGTWNNLHTSYSAPAPETNPDTPTVTFRGATYSSQYLSFTGYETASNKMVNGRFEPLDKLEPDDEKLFQTYNSPPYVPRGGSIPWMTIGGTAVQSGASFASDPLLGKTHAQIIDELRDPNSATAKGVLGAANLLTAQMCVATKNQPADVCTSPGVITAAATLK